jgi:hypothetical protein
MWRIDAEKGNVEWGKRSGSEYSWSVDDTNVNFWNLKGPDGVAPRKESAA